MARHHTLAAAAAALVICARIAGPAASPSGAPIVGGSVDAGHPAVGALLRGEEIWCTGTLVASRVVVTAAHCLERPITAVWFGARPLDGEGQAIEVVRQHVYPSYAPNAQTGDLGVVILAGTPAGIAPVPLVDGVLADAVVGSQLRVVGFGFTSPSDGTDRGKHEGAVRVAELEPTRLGVVPDPAQACFGDSGGPAFLAIDGVERLAGIVSSGDASCAGTVHLTRVDAYRAAFLDGFVAPTAGTRCVADEQCPGGLCLAPDDGGAAYCSVACDAGAACPGALTCTGGACVLAPSPGAIGASCAFGPDCTSGYCAQLGDEPACSTPCVPELSSSCPADLECVADLIEYGRFGCRAPASPSGGCSTGGDARASAFLVLLLLTTTSPLLRRSARRS